MSGGLFYVYEHWRPDKDECFYVGKGQKRRAHDMRRGRNRYHKFIQKKLAALGMCIEVRMVAEGLEEDEAFGIECGRIAFWRSVGVQLSNLTNGGEGPSGRKHTEEWKRANSERMKRRVVSKETRRRQSLAATGNKKGLGKKRPQAAIEKTRSALLGRKRSDEFKAKVSASKKGRPWNGRHTPDSIRMIREKQIGRPKSEETKARMRKPKSEAHKEKLRLANLGKTHSEETRKILSDKAKADWARRKVMEK